MGPLLLPTPTKYSTLLAEYVESWRTAAPSVGVTRGHQYPMGRCTLDEAVHIGPLMRNAVRAPRRGGSWRYWTSCVFWTLPEVCCSTVGQLPLCGDSLHHWSHWLGDQCLLESLQARTAKKTFSVMLRFCNTEGPHIAMGRFSAGKISGTGMSSQRSKALLEGFISRIARSRFAFVDWFLIVSSGTGLEHANNPYVMPRHQDWRAPILPQKFSKWPSGWQGQ